MSDAISGSSRSDFDESPEASLPQHLTALDIAESIADALIIFDMEWRIVYINRQAETLYGITSGQVIGRVYWDIVPSRGTIVGEALEKSMNERVPVQLETASAFRGEKWVNIRVHPTPNGIAAYALDITARKLAEQSIRINEEQLRLVIDTIPVLISYLDANRRYKFVNRGYQEWLAKPLEQIVGMNIREALGERAFGIVSERVDRAMAGESVKFEARIPYPDGIMRDVEVNYVPHRGADGDIHGMVALVTDITQWKEAQRQVEEARARAERILENMSDAYIGLDADWRITYINEHAVRLGGVDPVAIVGKPIWDVFPRMIGTEFETLHRLAMATGEPIHAEVRNGWNDAWTEFHDYPSSDGLGIYFRDITERKKAEAELRRHDEQLRLALDAAHLGFWQRNIPTGGIEMSDRGRAILGFAPDQPLSYDSFTEVVHPDDREHVHNAALGSIREHTLYENQYRVVMPGGDIRWVGALGQVAYDESGAPVEMIGVVQDITERRNAEEERDQLLTAERSARAEAERANRLKDEFLSTLSHELRTPLNAILGWSQILSSGEMEETDITKGMEVIERNARMQTQIIDDLLDMSRIISGKIRLDIQQVDLPQIIEQSLDSIRPAAEGKEIRLQKIVDPLAGPVSGDPARLQQIVWNLLTNAIKFTPKGGRVQVILKRVNSHIEISVVDSGEGIKPEFLPYIFERFRQADATTTRNHGGLGLGLAIVKSLVELHGGSVRANSPGVGQGATFVVALPPTVIRDGEEIRDRPMTSRSAGTDGAPPMLNGVKVLVVDDEPDARELVRRFLEQSGAQVITASSAREALAAVPEHLPDVVISDIGMPGQDGYTLIRSIRSLPHDQGGATPALALTAFARSEDRRRAIMSGFQMHIAKPVEPSELLTMVASLSGRIEPNT
ncbi:MAG: PAS domain-containing protein [Bacteroidota bacterium]